MAGLNYRQAECIARRGDVNQILQNAETLLFFGFEAAVEAAHERCCAWRQEEAERLVPLFDSLIEQGMLGAAQQILYRLRSAEMEIGLARHLKGVDEADYFLGVAQGQIDGLKENLRHQAQRRSRK